MDAVAQLWQRHAAALPCPLGHRRRPAHATMAMHDQSHLFGRVTVFVDELDDALRVTEFRRLVLVVLADPDSIVTAH